MLDKTFMPLTYKATLIGTLSNFYKSPKYLANTFQKITNIYIKFSIKSLSDGNCPNTVNIVSDTDVEESMFFLRRVKTSLSTIL